MHRDVKPGNVLLQLEPNGHWHALLADFGIARGSDGSSHRTQVSGTLAYMAPEQFTGKFSPASDQYALAVMTYQLLTGHTPFEGDIATLTHGHMYGTPPSVRSYNAALPATVDGVLNRALAKDPAQRYPTVTEYGKALQVALAQKSAAGDAVAPPLPNPAPAGGRVSQGPAPQWPGVKRERQPSQPGLRRVWLALLAAVVLLVGIVGVGGYIVQQQQAQQHATQTRTAQQAANAHATAAAQQTRTAQQTAAAQTATAQQTPIPSPSTTPGSISDNVTIPPAPPSGVDANTTLISDPSPFCGAAADDAVGEKQRCGDLLAQLAAALTLQRLPRIRLGCIQRTDKPQADGFVTAIAQPGSRERSCSASVRRNGNPVGGSTATPGDSFNITGYYFQVDPAAKTYSIFKVDRNGQSSPVASGNLSSGLAAHFAVSVLYKGSQITVYINGIQVATTTDTTYTSGWMSLCTSGETIYTNAIMYPLAS